MLSLPSWRQNVSYFRTPERPGSFCDCLEDNTGVRPCVCGEIANVPYWRFSQTEKTNSALLLKDNLIVLFHNGYSRGTGCIKGDTPLLPGNHYFWELKIVRAVYGTSVMIGVGTEKVNVNKYSSQYSHLLGEDDQSWGLTFDGRLRHNGQCERYKPNAGFSYGCIVGVHLDAFRGTLEFYLNREPFGIAFANLANKVLYPIISSTAGRSSMKLIYSICKPHSLAFECLRQMNKNQVEGLPLGLNINVSECWWTFPKVCKGKSKKRNVATSTARKVLYVVFDSDDEDENEGNRALALRMKRVLENSSVPSSESTSQSMPRELQPLYKKLRH